MKSENKIIKLFIENKELRTIRAIAQEVNSDYRIIHTATKRLIEKGILFSKSIGKSTLCELNQNYFGNEIYRVESERKDNLLRNKNIRQLYREIMKKVNTGFFIFLIFGSYTKNKQTKSSDLDLMFISNDEDFEENIQNIVSLLPIKNHVLIFTEDEFTRMKETKKSNVVKEIIENNVILYGIENYYRLKNAE
ncbi:nucleotidyltransferase domain-containing protein [Nanoarchaeota archaeon]